MFATCPVISFTTVFLYLCVHFGIQNPVKNYFLNFISYLYLCLSLSRLSYIATKSVVFSESLLLPSSLFSWLST